LFSILSLSGPLFGEPDTRQLSGKPDRVSQMMVLIKTVSKTNSPLFCLSVIYIQKSSKRWKKDFFADTENISGLSSIYFHAKTILSVFWLVKRHSVKPHTLHFQVSYECDVIFAIPQICAYFVDNSHNFEID
jgi:hypothetical protein